MNSQESFEGISIVRQERRCRPAFYAVGPGKIELRIPVTLPDSIVKKILSDHRELIEQMRQKSLNRPQKPKKQLVEGENFLYLGVNYPLCFSNRLLTFDQAFIIPRNVNPAAALEALYRQLAYNFLIPRCREITIKHSLELIPARISGARTRWGSCNQDGGINLSWRLIQLPEPQIDYVICHEICHRFVFNHSSAFWARLQQMLPDFEIRSQKIRQIEKSGTLW